MRAVGAHLILTTKSQAFTQAFTQATRSTHYPNHRRDKYGFSTSQLVSFPLLQVATGSRCCSCNHSVTTMSLSRPRSQISVDISSSLIPPSFIDTVIPKVAAPSVGSTADDSSLWNSILDTYGKEILEYASHEFLDLAKAQRLETINAGDLISLVAKAGRLGGA